MTRLRPGDAVVVTGASSGLGLDMTVHLAEAGFKVVAGYRDPADRARLEAIAGCTPVMMDVTDERSLQDAAASLSDFHVRGLVVNAGIAVAGPIEVVALDDLREQFEINVVGAVATVQAFLPHLRPHGGRIILMSSVSGRRSAPVLGPYAASKFALEAIGDALRMEVGRDGIEIIVLEPGGVRTPIWSKARARGESSAAAVPDERLARYEDMIDAARAVTAHVEAHGLDPSDVSALVASALTVKRPRTRYPLGKRVGLQTRVLVRLLPDRWFDRLRMKAMGIDRRRDRR